MLSTYAMSQMVDGNIIFMLFFILFCYFPIYSSSVRYANGHDTCVAANVENAWDECSDRDGVCATYGGNANTFGFLWNQLVVVRDAYQHEDFVVEGCTDRVVIYAQREKTFFFF